MKLLRFVFYFSFIQFVHSQNKQIEIHIKDSILESSLKSDSMMTNNYFGADSDTIWFASSDILVCDFMMSTDKFHNKCRFNTFGKAMNGFYTIYLNPTHYKGTFNDGLLEDVTIHRVFKNNSPQMSGQYAGNWKIGFWTYFYENGRIESLCKFIEGADYPVVEWEYDADGKLTYFNDEEDQIRKLLQE